LHSATESTALDVLEGFIEATYTGNRGRILEAVKISSKYSQVVRYSRESGNPGTGASMVALDPRFFAGVTSAKLRLLFRLSTELQLLDQRRYEHASRGIDEIGRMVGDWIRAHRGQAAS
jgi:hypothetical protein